MCAGLSEDGEGLYLVERNMDGWFPCFFVQMRPYALNKFLAYLKDGRYWRPEWVCGDFRVRRVKYQKHKARFLFFACGLLIPMIVLSKPLNHE